MILFIPFTDFRTQMFPIGSHHNGESANYSHVTLSHVKAGKKKGKMTRIFFCRISFNIWLKVISSSTKGVSNVAFLSRFMTVAVFQTTIIRKQQQINMKNAINEVLIALRFTVD